MITEFVTRFDEARSELREFFAAKHPACYGDIVKKVISVITEKDEYDSPDPERITAIEYGDYQGTILYVIAAHGYQPDNFWYVKVDYGSCCVCDTLQGLQYDDGDGEVPTEKSVEGYMSLALHIVQGLKKLGDSSED